MTTIVEIEFYVLSAPAETRPHWVSLFKVPTANELLVRMKSSDGVEGFGLGTSYTDISPIANVIKDGLAQQIIGMDPLAPEQVYQKIFNLTSSRYAAEHQWSREALIRISSAVDLACWDIVGKTAGMPLYRLLVDIAIRFLVTSHVLITGTVRTTSNCEMKSRCLLSKGIEALKAKSGE